jgi:hypothetical protein
LLALLFCAALRRLKSDGKLTQYAQGLRTLATGWWGGILMALLAADWIENLASWLVLDEWWEGVAPTGLVYALKAATTAKWLLLFLLIALLALLTAVLLRPGLQSVLGAERLRERLEPLTRVRLQLVLLALFGASILVPPQGLDVIRRWDLVTGSAAIAATFVYAYFSWDVADRLIGLSDSARKGIRLRWWALAGLVLTALGGLMLWRWPSLPWGVLVPGILLLVIAGASRVVASDGKASTNRQLALDAGSDDESWRMHQRPAGSDITRRSKALAHVLAAGPPVALGLAMVRASVGQLSYAKHAGSGMWALLLLGIALTLLGWGLSTRLGQRATDPTESAPDGARQLARWGALAGAAIALVTVALALIRDGDLGWTFARSVGTVGIVATFALVLALVGGAVVWAVERVDPPAFFRVLNLRRIPIFTLVLIWVLIAARFDPPGYHDVRLLGAPSGGTAASGVTVVRAFDRWLERADAPTYTSSRRLAARARTTPAPLVETRVAVPMTFTAASGGGVRAAYWTSLVLDCLYERAPTFEAADSCDNGPPYEGAGKTRGLFALSGISGGSLGLVAYASQLVGTEDSGYRRDWVDERLDEDFLAPTLGWQLFVESARALFRFDPPSDRAAIMEESWERAWQDNDGRDLLKQGLRATWRDHPDVPLLLLNGSSVNDGCRFETSVLNAGPPSSSENCLSLQPFERAQSASDVERTFGATLDLMDFLCRDQDLALSTAALLSARFPGVSPPGRLEPQCTPGDTTYIVDGGYLESSGASPLVELWRTMQPLVEAYDELAHPRVDTPCLVPFYVQIDNGYEVPDVAPRDQDPGDLTSPRKAQGAARGAWLAGAREAAAIAFRKPFTPGRTAVMQGGWPLTNRYQHIYPRAHPAARADLRQQLDSPDNRHAIGQVREWSRTVTCAPSLKDPRYSPAEFDLGSTVDLSSTWRASDTRDMLSFFRNREQSSVSVAFLRPGLDANDVADRLTVAVRTQAGVEPTSTTYTLGGLTGRRVAYSACEVPLDLEILPTHLVSPTSCASEEFRAKPVHDVFPPSAGGGLRVALAPGEHAASFVSEYAGRVVVLTITGPTSTSVYSAQAAAALVLSSLEG